MFTLRPTVSVHGLRGSDARPDEASRRRAGTVGSGFGPLAWTGAVIGGLAGALAGLVEAWWTAEALRSGTVFGEVFGYAVLLDAAVFALVGVGLTLLASWVLRATRTSHAADWAIAFAAGLVCLAIGGLFLLVMGSRGGDGRADPVSGSQTVAGVWLCLALLVSLAFAPWRGSSRFARRVGRRIALILLLFMLGVALVGIARDLNAHGFTETGSGRPHLSAQDQPASQTSGPARWPPLVTEPAQAEPQGATRSQSAREPASVPTVGAPVTRPNVLLITIDSLRADRVGAYGYAGARTPTLDRLAADGVLFARTYTSRNGTTPAHATIFTGAYPARHGIRSHMFDLLSPGVTTLAEAFHGDGYATAGLFSWLAFEPAYSGLDRGFEVYADLTVNLPAYLADPRTSALASTYKRLKSVLLLPGAVDSQMAFSADIEESLDGKADVTTDAALLWLRQRGAQAGTPDRPFFLWIHYWDPHYPYTPPPPFDAVALDGCETCPDGSLPAIRSIQSGARLDEIQARHLARHYDGEIAFTDQELGRLLAGLAETGLDRSTLVVVMGDHGECFGELGCWLHGFDLLEPEIHVPLIMRFPNEALAGRRVDAVASNADVMPTLLEYAGLTLPPTVEGRSLLPLIWGSEAGHERYAVSELADRSIVSYVTREWQLLTGPEQAVRLFRISPAGHGRRDEALSQPDVVLELGRRLGRWQAEHP